MALSRRKFAWLVAALASPLVARSGLSADSAATAATSTSAAQAEIAHLLAYLGQSGCRFDRNGTWHDATEARAHLDKKARYLADRGQIASAEDFIEKAATQSSMSGRLYLVKCGAGPAEPSARWLRAELERFRAANAGKPR